MQTNTKKVVVGMSGGIDSSVALILLKKQGWEPIGVTLKLPAWQNKNNTCRDNVCCTPESIKIAREICRKLNIPYFVIDAQKEFQKAVVNYFVKELKKYHTPNPCVICNRNLKFKLLLDAAKKFRAPSVATGHYARIYLNKKTGLYELLKGKDKIKDQSYSLSDLSQKELKHLILPLGNYQKQEVYQLAKKYGCKYFTKKKESQNFCFVSNKALPEFIKQKLGINKGLIKDLKGNVLGEHQGLYFYTIGQRKGLKLSGGPYYVTGFEIKNNVLLVSKNKKDLLEKEIFLAPYHFISGKIPQKKIKVQARIRYRQPLSAAILYPPRNKKIKIVFAKPPMAVTPGQFCVFYSRNTCLGNGIII
ncbi:MAG: tRNA 2-thiouridine(34) synthase MnmA [Parcubacteria group bacterium]|nr:tRNA 2-thiouridine(34) synthase MnmA [Parcubacteria group bacterium]